MIGVLLRAFVSVLAMTLLTAGAAAQDGDPLGEDGALPPGVLSVTPEPGSTIANATPLIVVAFDPDAEITAPTLALNGLDVSSHDTFVVTPIGLEYEVVSIFAFTEGTQNITLTYSIAGQSESFTWSLTVDLSPPPKESAITLGMVILTVLLLVALLAVATFVLLAYLKRTRNFTLRKFFARYPVHRNLLVLYVPLAVAGIGTLLALYWLTTVPEKPRFALESVFLAGAAIGIGPYAVDMQRERARNAAVERAYAQFLFELADALRGGIDPLKAITELAKMDTGILGRHLRVAADGIRLGRPFEDIMREMAKKLKSPLIERYSLLVAEASLVGGEIASVVHRAAKDMDEMVKVDRERTRQLKTPVMTMYIAYGVLLLMVKSLMDFAPGLAETDFGGLSTNLDAQASVNARMTLQEMQDRFFHLVLITSIGTGLLIGSFTDGKARYGMVHAFVMAVTAAAFYRFVVL